MRSAHRQARIVRGGNVAPPPQPYSFGKELDDLTVPESVKVAIREHMGNVLRMQTAIETALRTCSVEMRAAIRQRIWAFFQRQYSHDDQESMVANSPSNA